MPAALGLLLMTLMPTSIGMTAESDSKPDLSLLPRERILINDHWRFYNGPLPAGELPPIYDVFPVPPPAPNRQPTPPMPTATDNRTILRPWILPTGNAFIGSAYQKDPVNRYQRPPDKREPSPAFARPSFDDRTWKAVDLPHDWAIEGPFLKTGNYGGMGRLKTWGPAWYRRRLDIGAKDKGKSIFLDIDGAMSYAAVWLNGHLVGGWPYGYASWRVDLTPYTDFGGDNVLAIQLDNPPDSARWYPGAGIYRNVWLTKTKPIHVGQWGTYVRTAHLSSEAADLEVGISLDNDGQSHETVGLAVEVYALKQSGKRTGRPVAKFSGGEMQVAAKASSKTVVLLKLEKPKLWGPPPTQKPNLYVAVTTILRNGRAVDRYETPFGIRTVNFDPNKGVLVNGEHIQLKGVNNHHDLGSLGSAFNVRAAERQLQMLQAMGCNALRMSHNPPAPELLDLADRMGFLVIDEIFDSWKRPKTAYDFHLIFDDWHEQDLRAFIRRDRNHPSVFLWSVGNEVGEQFTGEEGAALGRALVEIAHNEDPTRKTMTAMNASRPGSPMPNAVDVVSINYQGVGIRTFPSQFPEFHKRHPDKVILSSETAAALSTRGEYQFPVPKISSGPVRPGVGGDPVSHQVSAYELFAADFGSSADKSFEMHERHPFAAGEFVWTGWDYIGEPTPYYDARSSYFGIIDLAGFPKDRYYLYQAHWRPDFPMAHILPHWTWPDRVGQVTPIHVFTSGDEAELFINGKSQGRKKKGPYEYRLRWDDVVYEPGSITVYAYKNGKRWATDQVRTAGAPGLLELKADRDRIAADGRDLSFVTVKIVDHVLNVVPQASDTVKFSIEGPGEIVATDNGDPTSFEPFHSVERKAFHGLCLVIVKAKAKGQIKLRAESGSLAPETITINAG